MEYSDNFISVSFYFPMCNAKEVKIDLHRARPLSRTKQPLIGSQRIVIVTRREQENLIDDFVREL